MENPLVSIIVPVFNGEEFIEDCLKSIKNQSYKNIELIVVDDGSIDNTKKIVQKFECRYIYQKNLGQSSALNKGWKNSNGSVLSYLSSDDILEKDCVLKIINNLDENIDIIYPNYNLIDSRNRIISKVDYGSFSKKGLCEDLICFPGPGTFFKKKVFVNLNGWNNDLNQVADFDYWLRASENFNFFNIPLVLANFRVHKGSGSSKKISFSKSEEIINVVKKFHLKCKKYKYKKAIISSYKIAAYHHFKSRRFLRIIYLLLKSFIISPKYTIRIYSKIALNKL